MCHDIINSHAPYHPVFIGDHRKVWMADICRINNRRGSGPVSIITTCRYFKISFYCFLYICTVGGPLNLSHTLPNLLCFLTHSSCCQMSGMYSTSSEIVHVVLDLCCPYLCRPVGEPLLGPSETVPRPRTSDPRRPATAAAGIARPRGAWGTCNPSPHSGKSGTLPRPLSAGPFHRPQLPGPVEITVDRTLVLSDSQLPPSDPAIPLIAAIKEELRKFQGTNIHPAISLPGSTSLKP